MRKLRIAQIGVLHEHASGKMETLRREFSECVDIVGIAPESPAAYDRACGQHAFQGLTWFSQDDLLNQPDLDAVFIETEMTELVETAMKAIRKNLPIHIDKPAGGEHLASFIQLLDEAEKRQLLVQPAYMFRGSRPIAFAKQAVRSGWLGDISVIDANMHRFDLRSPQFRAWHSAYAGGSMFNYGSHLIDIVVDLFGEPQDIIAVKRQLLDDGLNDNMVAILAYDRAIATIKVSLGVFNPAQHRTISFHGSHGFLQITPIEQGYDTTPGYPTFNRKPVNIHLELARDNDTFAAGTYDFQNHPMKDRYVDQLQEFFDIITGKRTNPYTKQHEIIVQKTVLKAAGYPLD